MSPGEPLIPKHGGYRGLKSFQVAQLVFDVTVRFCELYVDKRSRSRDQMIQAARSGVQNIAEGSQASGTSRKSELKLTNVARASLEELRLDYEDYLRQRGLPVLAPGDPALMRFKRARCATLHDVQRWVAQERDRQRGKNTDEHGQTRTRTDGKSDASASAPQGAPQGAPQKDAFTRSVSVRVRPCQSVSSPALVANAALSLLNLACHLLDRQLAAQARAFENEGGFTERLHRVRTERRDDPRP